VAKLLSQAPPTNVAAGWAYQGHFAGDSLYKKSDSTIRTYSTVKHAVTLGLAVLKTGDPSGTTSTTVEPGQNYKVQGTLRDSLTGTWLQGKTITFTADDPITISGKPTNLNGFYSGSQTAPGTSGTYDIQSHFAGDALYSSRDSVTRTLTVSSPSIAASTTDAERSTAEEPASNDEDTTSDGDDDESEQDGSQNDRGQNDRAASNSNNRTTDR
jgi:hypothetical protein